MGHKDIRLFSRRLLELRVSLFKNKSKKREREKKKKQHKQSLMELIQEAF